MRCPDCNKFVGFDQQDPEVQLDVSAPTHEAGAEGKEKQGTATVNVEVRLVLACAECGTELKETQASEDQEVEFEGHEGEGHELSVEETNSETTSRQDGKAGTPSRYRRTYYGASVSYEVRCECGETVGDGQVDVECQASGFDELV